MNAEKFQKKIQAIMPELLDKEIISVMEEAFDLWLRRSTLVSRDGVPATTREEPDEGKPAKPVENPALHALYVQWACPHILAINKAIDDLGAFANLNLMDAQQALVEERDKLIKNDPAYQEADKILHGLMPYIKKSLRYTTQESLRENANKNVVEEQA